MGKTVDKKDEVQSKSGNHGSKAKLKTKRGTDLLRIQLGLPDKPVLRRARVDTMARKLLEHVAAETNFPYKPRLAGDVIDLLRDVSEHIVINTSKGAVAVNKVSGKKRLEPRHFEAASVVLGEAN